MRLAFCWAHGRRKLIRAKPRKSQTPERPAHRGRDALLRIAALYKIKDAICDSAPDHRVAVRQELARPQVDRFFAWLKAQAARVSRKSDLGEAMACMLKRQDGFSVPGLTRPHRGPLPRSLLDDGRTDIEANLVENAISSPAVNRRIRRRSRYGTV